MGSGIFDSSFGALVVYISTPGFGLRVWDLSYGLRVSDLSYKLGFLDLSCFL